MMQIWLPLISTIVGGIIALTGSLIVQLSQQRAAGEKERKALLRTKLDEIGHLANELEDALQLDMAQIVGTAGPNDRDIVPPVSRKLQSLVLTVNLYHPVLLDAAVQIEQACSDYINAKRDLLISRNRTGKFQKDERQNSYQAFEKCVETKKDFLTEVIGVACTLRAGYE